MTSICLKFQAYLWMRNGKMGSFDRTIELAIRGNPKHTLQPIALSNERTLPLGPLSYGGPPPLGPLGEWSQNSK